MIRGLSVIRAVFSLQKLQSPYIIHQMKEFIPDVLDYKNKYESTK